MAIVPGKIHVFHSNITVVVDVFTEILIYNLRSSFVKGGKKAPLLPK